MWWFKYVVIISWIYASKCQNVSLSEEELEIMYNDAIGEVLAQHAEASARPRSPPYFSMPDNFMRSFVPGTGVGNREELVIDGIFPLPVFEDTIFSRFIFKHFNNTDYIAGISESYMILLKINASADDYIMLSKDDAVLITNAEPGIIKDVALFTRIAENVEVLSVAVVIETPKASLMYISEVIGDVGVMVSMIDLNIDPSRTSSVVKKIAYVQSSQRGSLVVLTETAGEIKLKYNRRGHSKLNHYIEVNYPLAVDMITFTVHGHGYIAVANAEVCDIFKLDEFVGSEIHFHRLGPFTAIAGLEYFRLGFHHFLAVTDFEKQYLYTWKKGEFALKQTMVVPNMAQVYSASVESCRDEVMLLAVTWSGEVDLYIFSGETEDFKKVDIAVPEGYSIQPRSITSFASKDSVVLLFRDINSRLGALVIKTSLISLRDPLLAQGEEVAKIMKNIQDLIDSQNNEIKRMQKMLKNAVRSSGTQRITNVQYFEDIIATNGTETENINKHVVEWEDSALTLEEYRRGTDDLEKTIESIERAVANIEAIIPDVVRLDKDAVITGQKIFTGDVTAKHLITTSLKLQNVAEIDLPKLQREIYRLDNPEVIDGVLTFKEPLIVTGNFDVDTTVNGIDISEEVMTTDTEQVSNAEMTFMKPLVIRGDLGVSGKVNGIDISEEVVTLDGSHDITAPKNFLNGIQAENVQTRFLDGIDIDDLYRIAFTISGKQTITGDASFASMTTNNIILNGRLNGYDIGEVASSIVKIDEPTKITGHKIFTNDVTVDGELVVHGTVNGLKIPDDLVFADVPQIITGTKEFLGQVTAGEVNVHGLVDGLKLPRDIITLSKDEEISSTLYFADGIEAEKNIIVEGLVDGVDISEIAKQAMRMGEANSFKHAVFLGPVTITGNLNIRGLVNKIDFNKLLEDIVYRDEKPLVINSRKNFKNVTASKVNLDHSINGYNINVDFMRVRGDQNISGTKTFKNTVFNSLNIEDGLINGISIADLHQRSIQLEIEKEEAVVISEIEFVDNVVVNDLTIQGTINGLRIPEDVVLRNSTQSISNKHFAGPVIVDNLVVDGDVTVDTFGGINLTDFYNDRITLSGDQDIPGDMLLGNSTASDVSISGLVNGVDIAEFADNILLKSKPNQVVKAAKEFSGGVTVFGDIRTSAGINGFNLTDINRRAFKLLDDNVVTAPLEFEDNITCTNLFVGDINGVNLTRLSEDSLKKTGDIQYVKGDTFFEAGFHVDGDIEATKINDLVLADDILLKTVPQTITGQFSFQTMAIDGDLKVKGLINGLNLTEVLQKLPRIGVKETVIESNVTFTQSVRVHENIDVAGTVNGVDFKKLFDSVLRKTGSQTITGHKTFRGNITVTGDVKAKYVNGIDWEAFLNDVVWINKPQVVNSPKVFKGDVIVHKGMFVSGSAHVGRINGIDLNKFVNDAVFIDEPTNITGPIIFKNHVEILGDLNADLINGLNLKTDVITIVCSDDGPQMITGQKTFRYLKVFGDIYTDAVNSYDLQALYEDTLLTEGNQTIKGRKTVYGDVTFKRDVYPDTVNGMILNKDLVTLDTDQEIDGPLTFQEDINVKKDMFIDGLLNGVDLHNLSRDAVYVKTDQTIEGAYTFENVTVNSNVEVNGTVNGLDLVAFDKNVTKFIQEAKETIGIMEQHADDHCRIAKYLQKALENSYYALDSFAIHQDLEFAASFVQIDAESVFLVSVDDTAKSTTSVKTTWDNDQKKLVSSNFSLSSVTKKYLHQIGSVAVAVNVGINSKDSSVVANAAGHPVELQNGFVDASVLLRKTEAVIALMFSDKSICDVYLLKEHAVKGYSYELDSSLTIDKESTSIAIFEMSGVLYLAVSSFHSPFMVGKVYAKKNKSWQLIQRMQASGSFVKHFEYQNYHYLAFANSAPVHQTKERKSIQIYRNSGFHDSMFLLFQKVPFDDARGMELFKFGDISQLHLVAWNDTRIQIYDLEGESGMKELVTIYEKCVRDVKPLMVEDDLYLVVGRQNVQKDDTVTSILYKGLTKGSKYRPYNLSYC